MSIKMLTLNLLKKCGTKQLRTIFIYSFRASWKNKMTDADEFQNVLWHVAQILQSILLSRIQIIFIAMYVRPNPSKKCGICTLFSVQFITRTKILLRFWCGLHMGDSLHSVSCQFLELSCCLSHRDAKILMSPGIDFWFKSIMLWGT